MADELVPEGVRGTTGYPSIVPYLLVENGLRLIEFLELGFGAKRRFVMPSPENGVMHAEVDIGNGLLMLSDSSQETRANAQLCLYVEDVDAAYEKALSAGALSVSPPNTKDYGDRVAGIKDPAGNTWWICTRIR